MWAARLLNTGIEIFQCDDPLPQGATRKGVSEFLSSGTPLTYAIIDDNGLRPMTVTERHEIDEKIKIATAEYQADLLAKAATDIQLQAEARAAAEAAPFKISKIKVLLALQAISPDALAAFINLLNEDSIRKLLWDASVVLDSDNDMVLEMLPILSQMLGCDASEFMKNCKSDL